MALNELAPIVKLAKHIVFLDAPLDEMVLTVTKDTFFSSTEVSHVAV